MTPGPESQSGADEPSPGRAAEHATDHDLRALFGQSTAVFVSLAGPAHVVEAANGAFFAAIGEGPRARTGLPLVQLAPELTGQGVLALLDRVYRTGKAHVARDARVTLGAGAAVRDAFFDFTCEPRLDAGGDVTGVRVIGVETTQVKHAQLLMFEHRALLEQIARQAPLEQVLEGMARAIEDVAPEEVLVSVLLADDDGRRLRHGAGPSLPDFYNRAIDGIAAGEGVGSCGTAAHRRQMVVVTDIADDPLWADFRDLARAAGVAACWSTPILARDGSLLGTFAMYHRAPRAPQESDLALARVFASTAALAIERHQAEQARRAAEAREESAREDLAFLLRASTALTSDLDYAQTLRRLAASCVPALAPLCAVDISDAGRIRRIATAGASVEQQQLLAAHTPVYDAEDNAVARVLASGVTEVARRTPAGPGSRRDLEVTGYLCVPLVDRGHAFGTLTLLTTGDRAFDGHAVALAEELARRAAPAAVNARQYSQRTALARDLQAGLLLPGVPALPAAADAAVYYHPADEGLEVGGDFYDIFPLPCARWAFMLGDVCGRGAKAAATTALVRHTARAVAPLLPDPGAVVQAVNQALLNRPDSHGTGFVTMVYGHFAAADDGGLDLTLVRAGHPLPLHIKGRSIRPVHVHGSLLGMTDKPHVPARRLRLEPSESLLLYTDGISEARNGEGDQFGDERLARALSRDLDDTHTAQQVINALTAAVRTFADDASTGDDQAALVLTAQRKEQEVEEVNGKQLRSVERGT